ncbi:MAG: efflux RND transporter permease subunit [Planctomycetes bacterium]|nr:efflux RND transporter permease subunit [Planctomycetota bacterium]
MRSASHFFSFAVRRPVGLFVVFVTLVVIGAIAYARIPLQLLPSGFSDDSVQIWVPNPGASARENEEKVARIIEEELNTLQGIKRLRSSSNDDLVTMSITFQSSVDMNLAKAEVRDRLERARPKLPATTEQIGMWSESGGSLPLSFFSVTHLGDSDETDFLIDEVAVPRLEAADGVSKSQIWGVLQDTVRIQLDEDRVAGSNLDVMGLIQGLSSDNFSQPLGEVVDGGERLILRSDMRFKTPEEIAEYPIGNGMKISDVGRVTRSKSVRDRVTRVDGKYAYFGIAQKESSANVVEASRNFRAAIEELRNDPAVAGKLDFVPFFLQGDMIESSLNQLMTTAFQGGLFAAIVLLMFLKRIRTTICVALAIPFSALLALAFEYFTGGSFNLLTMIGITLAIGMLVDNAVVVVENILRVRPETGSDLEAAAEGTREIALPVTLATLTTVVVFLPVIFMSDNPMARVMLGGMGLPLCAALIASLLVAVVFLPVITARVIRPRGPRATQLALATGFVMRIPARALAVCIGAARWGFHQALRVAFVAERATLRVLTPLRWPLAIALVAGATYFATQEVESGAAAALVGGNLNTQGEAMRLALTFVPRLLPALLGALLLILGTPAWRRRLVASAAPARPAQLVPAGHSLIDWLISSNRALVAWTLEHRRTALVLSLLAFLTVMIPLKKLGESAFSQGDGDNSIEFGVSFDANFTLAEASRELLVYEDYVEAHREDWGFSHWRDSFDDRGGELALFYEDALPALERKRVLGELRTGLPKPPGHRVRFFGTDNISETSNTVASFTLRGTDSGELTRLGAEARVLLEGVPGLAGVTLPDAQAPDEIRVAVNRDTALSLGYDSMNAVESIVRALHGQT